MSDNLESLNNDGGQTVKMDLNYSAMCDEKIAEAESLRASGKLQEALDMLLVVENETRNVSDLNFFIFTITHLITCTIITL